MSSKLEESTTTFPPFEGERKSSANRKALSQFFKWSSTCLLIGAILLGFALSALFPAFSQWKIRDDPFAAAKITDVSPSTLLDRFISAQPDPRMATSLVVPAGETGTLVERPPWTQWLSQKTLPDDGKRPIEEKGQVVREFEISGISPTNVQRQAKILSALCQPTYSLLLDDDTTPANQPAPPKQPGYVCAVADEIGRLFVATDLNPEWTQAEDWRSLNPISRVSPGSSLIAKDSSEVPPEAARRGISLDVTRRNSGFDSQQQFSVELWPDRASLFLTNVDSVSIEGYRTSSVLEQNESFSAPYFGKGVTSILELTAHKSSDPQNLGIRRIAAKKDGHILVVDARAVSASSEPSDAVDPEFEYDVKAIITNFAFGSPRRDWFGNGIGYASSAWGGDLIKGVGRTERPVFLKTTNWGQTWERLGYRDGPAPIGYPLLLLSLIAFLGAAITYKNEKTQPKGPQNAAEHAVSDRPINWQDNDATGIKPLATALSKFLRNIHTTPPVTVAVQGPWGSGKSSLMNLVAQDLRENGARPVWFNAWHHQTEESLLAALMETIRNEGLPPLTSLSGIVFRMRLLWERRARTRTIGLLMLLSASMALFYFLGFGTKFIDGLTAASKKGDIWKAITDNIGTTITGAGALGTAFAAVVRLFSSLTSLRGMSSSLVQKLQAGASVGNYADKAGFRHRFATEFGEVCRILALTPQRRMTIFIDDLDRCDPKHVMSTLQTINFLSTSGDCFIIIGMQREQVIASIKEKYEGREELYLEKLINIEVNVPPPDNGIAAKMLLPPSAFVKTRIRASFIPLSSRLRLARLNGHRLHMKLLKVVPPFVDRWTIWLIVLSMVVGLLLYSGAQDTNDTTGPQDPKSTIRKVNTLDETPASSSNAKVKEAAAAKADISQNTEHKGAVQAEYAEKFKGDPLTLAIAKDARPHSVSDWILNTLTMILVAIFIYMTLQRLGLESPAQERDSDDFLEAIEGWSAVIDLNHTTPRGIKRFLNQVRFLALKGRYSQDTDSRGTKLEDGTIIAIGAIDAYDPSLLNDLNRQTLSERLSIIKNTAPGAYARLTSAVEESKIDPNAKQVEIYRRLNLRS